MIKKFSDISINHKNIGGFENVLVTFVFGEVLITLTVACFAKFVEI